MTFIVHKLVQRHRMHYYLEKNGNKRDMNLAEKLKATPIGRITDQYADAIAHMTHVTE